MKEIFNKNLIRDKEPICRICKGEHPTLLCSTKLLDINPVCKICGKGHETTECTDQIIKKNIIKKEVYEKKELVCDICGGGHKTKDHPRKKDEMTYPDLNWVKDRRPGE